jgi:DNA topoisomerase-1
VIKDGRFGPYVTDGETNASLRKGDDVESVTLQRAVELLAERRAAGPAKPRRRVATGSKTGTTGAKTGTARSKARSTTTRRASSPPRS